MRLKLVACVVALVSAMVVGCSDVKTGEPKPAGQLDSRLKPAEAGKNAPAPAVKGD